jgi:hypothetical protein
MTITATRPAWPGAAGKLAGVTADRVRAVTAGFTAQDWAQLEDEHLDMIGLRLFGGLEYLGVDMDDDPIAVFCHLYLAARASRLRITKGERQ